MRVTKKISATKRRSESYDTIGDQLDRITKALEHLSANGVDIGVDGVEQVNHCKAVKLKFIKDGDAN